MSDDISSKIIDSAIKLPDLEVSHLFVFVIVPTKQNKIKLTMKK